MAYNMKGNNEFRFNQATMIEIVQKWIDSHISDTPKVTAISYNSNSMEFTIMVSSEDKENEEP